MITQASLARNVEAVLVALANATDDDGLHTVLSSQDRRAILFMAIETTISLESDGVIAQRLWRQ